MYKSARAGLRKHELKSMCVCTAPISLREANAKALISAGQILPSVFI